MSEDGEDSSPQPPWEPVFIPETSEARIAPNRYPRPGPIGNTTGIIVPQTSPAPAGADTNPPVGPETDDEKSWWSKASSWVHLGLDVLGMVPVLGTVTSGIDAAIYTAEGDTVNAAISAASMIPIGGNIAKAGKVAVRGGRAAAKAATKKATKTAVEEAAEGIAQGVTKQEVKQAEKKGAAKAREVTKGSGGGHVKKPMRSSYEPKGIKTQELDAAQINKEFDKPPFKEGTTVKEYRLTEDEQFVRLYDGENSAPQGRWLMPKSEIEGLTPVQIRDKFALPQVPTMICDVKVPSGNLVRVGEAGKIPGWGDGNGIQVLLPQRIPTASYTNMRPFP